MKSSPGVPSQLAVPLALVTALQIRTPKARKRTVWPAIGAPLSVRVSRARRIGSACSTGDAASVVAAGRTVSGTAAEVLAAKLTPPWYAARIEWLPAPSAAGEMLGRAAPPTTASRPLPSRV